MVEGHGLIAREALRRKPRRFVDVSQQKSSVRRDGIENREMLGRCGAGAFQIDGRLTEKEKNKAVAIPAEQAYRLS